MSRVTKAKEIHSTPDIMEKTVFASSIHDGILVAVWV